MPGVLRVPPLEELDVQEVAVSSAVLKAAAHHYGSQCDRPNKEFMLCRWEEKDPRRCLREGRQVNQCAIDFFSWGMQGASEMLMESRHLFWDAEVGGLCGSVTQALQRRKEQSGAAAANLWVLPGVMARL